MNEMNIVFHRKPTVLNTETDVIYRMGTFGPENYAKKFQMSSIRIVFDFPNYHREIDVNRMHAFVKELHELKLSYTHDERLHCDGTLFTFYIDVISSVFINKRKIPADFLKRHQDLFEKVHVYANPFMHGNVDFQRRMRFGVYPRIREDEHIYHTEDRTTLLSQYLFKELTNAQSKNQLDIM